MIASRNSYITVVVFAIVTNCASIGAQNGRVAIGHLPPPSQRWALVVGVGDAPKSNLPRLAGDRDAMAFASALEEHAGFRNDHIVLLAGEDSKDCRPAPPSQVSKIATVAAASPCPPTRSNILAQLQEVTSKVPPSGLFVFFFSGHGQSVAGESVLFPSDLVYKDDPPYLSSLGLSAGTVADFIRGGKIKQVLMFIDACRDRVVEVKGVSPKLSKGFDLDKLNAKVEAFMTFYSGGEGSTSYQNISDKKPDESYFTSALVEALEGRRGAYDARHPLTLGGLVRYVKDNVQMRLAGSRGEQQVPEVASSGYLLDEVALAGRKVSADAHPELLSGSLVVMTPDGKRIYVANSRLGVINVFETVSGRAQQIIDLRPGKPGQMVLAARRGKLYVLEPVSQTVVVINAANQVVARLSTGVNPESLALTPDESKLYVSNQQPAPVGTISVLDAGAEQTRAVAPPITGVNCPEGLAMAPDGALMYVESQCASGDDPLFVVDTKTDTKVQSFKGFAVGTTALGMLPNGEKLYIGTGEPDRTSVLITATGDVKALGPPGDPRAYARNFATTPDGRYVLGVGGPRLLLIIDPITDEIVSRKDLGSPGVGIVVGVAPGTNQAVCYIWLPEENRLFFTALDGILAPDARE